MRLAPLLILLALLLVPDAGASAAPSVGHAEAVYDSHDVAVLTVDYVALADPTTGGVTVLVACTAVAPQLAVTVRCDVGSAFGTSSGAGAAIASFTVTTSGEPRDVVACVTLVGSSVPTLCTTRVV